MVKYKYINYPRPLDYSFAELVKRSRTGADMGEEKLEQTFFSSEYGHSYQLHEGTAPAKESSICLSAGSTLIARQSGFYGANASRVDTTISVPSTATEEADNGGLATRVAAKTHLLTEKIRKKKQGESFTGFYRGLQVG